MDIETLEAAIVAQLEGLGLVAGAYPENPDNYTPNAYPGEVLVRYTGLKPSRRDMATVNVDHLHSVELVFVSQQLRGANGLYTWLDNVRRHLDGFTLPEAAGYLEFTSEDFLDQYNGVWQFGQKWQLKTTWKNEQSDPYADRPLGA